MIGSLVGQLLGTAVAAKKQLIGPIITKIVLLLIGGILLIAGLAFVLVTIYHALTPWHVTAVQAAGIIALALLVIGGIVVLFALKASFRPSTPPVSERPDPQLAELSAIEALGMLNKSLTDISQGRGGGSAMMGLLGIAALVGFISGRKR
jgi:hypothetical protein